MSQRKPTSFDVNRGPIRALMFGVLAAGTGATSLYMLSTIAAQYQDKIDTAQQPEETVMAMVAARDLYQGITITDEDLYAVQIPPRYLPENIYLSPDHVVGRIPRERILANEFIRSGRLADPEAGQGLNAIIPRGMRAISVDIADGQALTGFLNPTNFVDILVTMEPEVDDAPMVTETILQAVFVLGVNSIGVGESAEQAEKRGKQKPSVTFLVDADQAEQIAHAEVLGDLRLALRNGDDGIYAETEGMQGLDRLRNNMQTVPEVLPTPPPRPVRGGQDVLVIRGDDRETVHYEDEPTD